MHNSYFFLAKLSQALADRLIGFTLVSCFSQNKEELVFEFNNGARSFFIKASLQPTLCCLSFPNTFHRAKKNSIDLFSESLMHKVSSVTQYQNERSFSINLTGGFDLLCKMHGSQSNVILFQNQKVVSIFRNQFQSDWDLDLALLNRTFDWSKENFLRFENDLQRHYFTLGKEFWRYLKEQQFEQSSSEEKWQKFMSAIETLWQGKFFVTTENGKPELTLLPSHLSVKEFSDPIAAINEFYYLATSEGTLQSEKTVALRRCHELLKGKVNYVARNQSKLKELTEDSHYQLWADLIMANMHQIKMGMTYIDLPSFYKDEMVRVKLKKDLNAQRNAEVFYRKAKNQQIEIEKLKESILQKQKEMEQLQLQILELESTDDLKLIRKTNEIARPKKAAPLPYREIEYKGFKVWIGKSAEANDELTLKHSCKEDLWLHAKDVAGSHVLIKHQANKPFPKDVIERGAALAAFYSRRKNETLCPVSVTPKKFVRKRKGDPAGMVVVEREDVLMVEPEGC